MGRWPWWLEREKTNYNKQSKHCICYNNDETNILPFRYIRVPPPTRFNPIWRCRWRSGAGELDLYQFGSLPVRSQQLSTNHIYRFNRSSCEDWIWSTDSRPHCFSTCESSDWTSRWCHKISRRSSWNNGQWRNVFNERARREWNLDPLNPRATLPYHDSDDSPGEWGMSMNRTLA